MRLFLLGPPLAHARAAEALAPLALDRALHLGVVAPSPAGIRAAVGILPSGDLLFACDRELESAPDLAADHVMQSELARIDFGHIGIYKLSDDQVQNDDNIARVTAELFCEEIAFVYLSGTPVAPPTPAPVPNGP